MPPRGLSYPVDALMHVCMHAHARRGSTCTRGRARARAQAAASWRGAADARDGGRLPVHCTGGSAAGAQIRASSEGDPPARGARGRKGLLVQRVRQPVFADGQADVAPRALLRAIHVPEPHNVLPDVPRGARTLGQALPAQRQARARGAGPRAHARPAPRRPRHPHKDRARHRAQHGVAHLADPSSCASR